MTAPEKNRTPGTAPGNRPFGTGDRQTVRQAPAGARPAGTPRRPDRIALPFDNRRRRAGTGDWIYRHRVGLLVTVVLYLIAAILFVSYKIVVYENPTTTMYVDLVDPDEPVPPKPTEEEEVKPKPVERIDPGQYEQVKNRRSDMNAKTTSSALKDDRGTQMEKLLADAERVQQELAANRQAFRSGLDEVAEMSRRHQMPKSSSGPKNLSDDQPQSVKVQGNVTVSYDLAGRTATYLHVPAYQCREGGTVVVGITVNRDGRVTNATVERASEGECIAQRARQAALASSFNADANAPDRQRGTITYVFVAQ